MANAVEHSSFLRSHPYYAERLAHHIVQWELMAEKTVWVVTTCRRKRVYEDYDAAFKKWETLRTIGNGRCDFLLQEKFCHGQHTLLQSTHDIPLDSFHDRCFYEVAAYFFTHPVLMREQERLARQQATSHLPEIALIPSASPITGSVYFISAESTQRVKIGRSWSVEDRREHLETSSPFPLVLLREIASDDVVALEKAFHRRYAQYRVFREWFELPIGVLEEALFEEFNL